MPAGDDHSRSARCACTNASGGNAQTNEPVQRNRVNPSAPRGPRPALVAVLRRPRGSLTTLPPFARTSSRAGVAASGVKREGHGCRRRPRREPPGRDPKCPQAATRAVSSMVAVMAGLRGKRERRELAKALVGVLLVRDWGSLGKPDLGSVGDRSWATAQAQPHQPRWGPASRSRRAAGGASDRGSERPGVRPRRARRRNQGGRDGVQNRAIA